MTDIDWERGESVIIGRTDLGQSILKEASEEGYISHSDRPVEELSQGQLMKEREMQLASYSRAFKILNPSISSHLLEVTAFNEISETIVNTASSEFSKFQIRETQSIDQIVSEARICIRNAAFQKSLPYRILSKLRKFIIR